MTMVIIGIIAAVAVPRFFDNNVFQSRGFADQVVASLRYAQKVAIAQHRFVCVAFTNGNTVTYSVGPTATCGTPLVSPTGAASYSVTAPSGISFASVPANFSFDAQGRPSFAPPAVTIGVTGAASVITIEPETGYVH